jgi:hypothetical protein
VIENEAGQIALSASGLSTMLALGLQRELAVSVRIIEGRSAVNKTTGIVGLNRPRNSSRYLHYLK